MKLSELDYNPCGPDPAPDPETIPVSWATWCCNNDILEKADQDLAATFVRRYLPADYSIALEMKKNASEGKKKDPLCTVVWMQSERPGFPELWKHLIAESKRQCPEHFDLHAAFLVRERERLNTATTLAETLAEAAEAAARC